MKEALKRQGWEGRGETESLSWVTGVRTAVFKTSSSVRIFYVFNLVLVGVNWNLVPIWDLKATVRSSSGRS